MYPLHNGLRHGRARKAREQIPDSPEVITQDIFQASYLAVELPGMSGLNGYHVYTRERMRMIVSRHGFCSIDAILLQRMIKRCGAE